MRITPVTELNPLFERELRGRWRKLNASYLLLLPVLLEMVVLYFLIREPLQRSVQGLATVSELRSMGDSILWYWRAVGGAVLVPLAMFIGSTSVLYEKESGTLEQVLLSPLGPRGFVRGKVLSGSAYLLVFQLVLLPLLLISSTAWLLSPAAFLVTAILHFMLTIQALAVGIAGAVRAKSLTAAVTLSVCGWLSAALMLGFGTLVITFVLLAVTAFLQVTELAALSPYLSQFIPYVRILAAGVAGVGSLLPVQLSNTVFQLAAILLGQTLSLVIILRFIEIWLEKPGEDWGGKEINAALGQLFSGMEPPKPAAPIVKIKNPHRLRLIPTKWVQNLNPVFWLDLQRCLSLRAPSPEAQIPLLLFFAMGGSIAFALGLATVVSWVQSILTGNNKSLAYLSDAADAFRILLCYAALLVGPLFASMGYVVERRSKMLQELRLTLLTARELWWGKFGARFIIPAIGIIPALCIIAFIAQNSPEPQMQGATAGTAVQVLIIATWSVLLCLVCSYHAPNQLASALWCLAFILATAIFVWPAAMLVHPWFNAISAPAAIRHQQWMVQFLLIYAAMAAGFGMYLWYRLKREGFV